MKRRAKGLTLIELMVTLAVAIVLLAIGIPAFNTLTARDVSAATVNGLVTALQKARVEAISGGGGVSVVAASGDWARGWSTNARDGTILRVFPAPRPQIAITGVAGGDIIEFGGRGERTKPKPTDVALVTFTVSAYSDSGRTACVRVTDVIVTGVGQVRSENKACP